MSESTITEIRQDLFVKGLTLQGIKWLHGLQIILLGLILWRVW